MSILKMVPGQKVAFTVERVEQVEGKFGPQFAFHGSTPDDAAATMYMNVDAAQRQLSRISLSPTSVVGQTVEFARTEKNGTKYTDINRLDNHAAHAGNKASTAKQGYTSGGPIAGLDDAETGAQPVAKTVPTLDKLFNLYDTCFAHAYSLAERTMKQDASHEGISAMAATIFIAAKERGLAA
jgi:hypothetical protein